MKKLLVACMVAATLAASAPANAALNAYLALASKSQGAIKGGVTQKGREGKIMVIAVEHQLRNDAGKKAHGVLTVTKELDMSSPLLYRALATGDVMTSFELQFWTQQMAAATGAGGEKQHYTVKLTNARITEIKFKMLNNKNPDLMKYAELEEVSFTYDAISWTWVDGGITASDTR